MTGEQVDFGALPVREKYGPPTTRGLQLVGLSHGYELNDFVGHLTGKLVLDIGVGYSPLADEVEQLGIGAKVISIDIHDTLVEAPVGGERTGREVAAVAGRLPFPDGVFDLTLATFSQPMYADSSPTIEQQALVAEGLRVSSPENGTFSMAPGSTWGDDYFRTSEQIRAHYDDLIDGLELPKHTFTAHTDTTQSTFYYAHDRVILQRVG